jgi:hypothetical protein
VLAQRRAQAHPFNRLRQRPRATLGARHTLGEARLKALGSFSVTPGGSVQRRHARLGEEGHARQHRVFIEVEPGLRLRRALRVGEGRGEQAQHLAAGDPGRQRQLHGLQAQLGDNCVAQRLQQVAAQARVATAVQPFDQRVEFVRLAVLDQHLQRQAAQVGAESGKILHVVCSQRLTRAGQQAGAQARFTGIDRHEIHQLLTQLPPRHRLAAGGLHAQRLQCGTIAAGEHLPEHAGDRFRGQQMPPQPAQGRGRRQRHFGLRRCGQRRGGPQPALQADAASAQRRLQRVGIGLHLCLVKPIDMCRQCIQRLGPEAKAKIPGAAGIGHQPLRTAGRRRQGQALHRHCVKQHAMAATLIAATVAQADRHRPELFAAGIGAQRQVAAL